MTLGMCIDKRRHQILRDVQMCLVEALGVLENLPGEDKLKPFLPGRHLLHAPSFPKLS